MFAASRRGLEPAEEAGMTAKIDIEFVSDVSCPWCVIGLRGLEQAIAAIGGEIDASIHLRPFELNPDMPREGEPLGQHVARKYGAAPEQSRRNRDMIRDLAAAVGFEMRIGGEQRIYNSFDAHRLLHWAGIEGRQIALKHALFATYFTEGGDLGDADVLVAACVEAGLDAAEARAILASDRYAADVRALEALNQEDGITAVPAAIVNRRYVLAGGQPPEVFERALRRIAAEG
jgi:predicted DsbA family dithiol-disulfide isomerase